jgi:hypothetical protein
MEQKRLFIAIAVSLAILLGFEFLVQPHLPHPPPPPPAAVASNSDTAVPGPTSSAGATGGSYRAGRRGREHSLADGRHQGSEHGRQHQPPRRPAR